jgi:integrase
MVLTLVRTRELRGARWNEFDFDRAKWRIPAERMKITAEHIVPLSKQAIAALRELQTLTGGYDLVFPNQNNLSCPMSENTLLYAIYRMGYHQWATVHGFRATAHEVQGISLRWGGLKSCISFCIHCRYRRIAHSPTHSSANRGYKIWPAP